MWSVRVEHFFILFDKARKRWMSCINSIWVTKIGFDGLNGEDCRRGRKVFLGYYFCSRIPGTSVAHGVL